ncbi:MAG: hypothetical protein QNJ34_05355 [Xenococcaceae cyanobacterium MO_188.B29]|nr:hypothetical protein [Xenococcaceae cyanobacterium MO_188.B29]
MKNILKKNIFNIFFLVINIILFSGIQQTYAIEQEEIENLKIKNVDGKILELKDFTIQNNGCTFQFLVNTNKIIEVIKFCVSGLQIPPSNNSITGGTRINKSEVDPKYIDNLNEAKINLELEKIKYEKERLFEIRKIYQNQRYSSLFILTIVICIVISGLYLSFYQLKLSYSKEKSEDNNTDLLITKEKVKISSSIVGVLILFISIGFFYLYLKEVYTIKIENYRVENN